MRKQDWALVAALPLYLVFVGPFLWSASDCLLVSLGFMLGVGLGAWAYKAIKFHFPKEKADA